jgi:peroxiredoxin
VFASASASTTAMAQEGIDINARMAAMWDDVQASNLSADLQRKYADELLEYYLTSGESDAGVEAGWNGFLMLANVADLSLLNESIKRLDDSAYLWSRIMPHIRVTYERNNEGSALRDLLLSLEDRLTHPESVSAAAYHLGEVLRRNNADMEGARARYERVVDLQASTFFSSLAAMALNEMDNLNLGQRAPDFSVADVNDGLVSLAEYEGKAILLAFVSHWCSGSLALRNQLPELEQRFADQEFVIIQVDMTGTVDHLFDEHGVLVAGWPVVSESNWIGGAVTSKFSAYYTPRSFLVDSAGMIAGKDIPAHEIADLVAAVLAKR